MMARDGGSEQCRSKAFCAAIDHASSVYHV